MLLKKKKEHVAPLLPPSGNKHNSGPGSEAKYVRPEVMLILLRRQNRIRPFILLILLENTLPEGATPGRRNRPGGTGPGDY